VAATAVTERTLSLPCSSPVAGKAVRVAFDGGRLTSDAGVLLLADIERRLGLAERLARCIEDPRSPERVHHTLPEMIRFRVLLIAAGYPDANDCDHLRTDPAFKMAVGRLPESGPDLCSQPTMCRLENLPTATALKRMMAAMVDLFCDSFAEVPRRVVLDIDDTCDPAHGRQQLAAFNAYYDERCFLPIHVYEAITGKPVAVILRPGKIPDGAEVMLVLRHVIRAIRRRWPKVDILVRGDGHYGRPEAMDWCERNRVGYVFGLAGNKVLLRRVAGLAEAVALERVESGAAKVRRFGEFAYAAQTWSTERRVIARVEASDKGADSRFVVTNLAGTPRWLYEAVYCARGRAENLVKAHKLHLASDRTSCSRATANPVPPGAAHGRLLAAAHPARLGAEALVLARRPARHDPSGPDQGGRPGRRAGEPNRARAAVRLPLPGQPHAPGHPGRETALSGGAVCPDRARPLKPPAPMTAPPGATGSPRPRLPLSGRVIHPGE
jgi:Transposase DDE domain group 1